MKLKFISVLPEAVQEKMESHMIDIDLGDLTFSKILQIADRFSQRILKKCVLEVTTKVAPVVVDSGVQEAEVAAAISLRPNAGDTSVNSLQCSHCKRTGHKIDTCWLLHPNLRSMRTENRGQASFNQSGQLQLGQRLDSRRCFACNQVGHLANACPQRSQNNFGIRPRFNAPGAVSFNAPRAVAFNVPRTVQAAGVLNSARHCNGCGATGRDFHFWKDCPVVQEAAQANMVVVDNAQLAIDNNAFNLNC
ncbi:unnamed protein product [Rotaria magnacalcarata]|uniref:CCHC-type domain-containing protein n=1 Tax=Rotaria magnacalcarata TaxID=392030 RepID=A0A816U5A3_9BILA|nr:unnamed protein product [Rotaria magnacalcarata]